MIYVDLVASFLSFSFQFRIFLGTKINETTSACNYEVSHTHTQWKHIAIGDDGEKQQQTFL